MPGWTVNIKNPGARELRKFGMITGAIVAGLFGLLLPWAFDYAWPLWAWIVAAVLWSWALVHPRSLFVVYRLWLRFGHVAGWINTRIILAILFYAVFFPFGLLMRLFGKDPMRRKADDAAASYRILSATMDKDHVERPY